MASFVADGLVIPVAIATHPALNFCNTRTGWGLPAPKEYLASHAHLTVWARENGLLSTETAVRLRRLGAREVEAAAAAVVRAVRLRSALYAVLLDQNATSQRDHGSTVNHWTAINHEVRAAAAAFRLATTAALPGGKPADWTPVEPSTVDFPVLAVARACAELLTSPLATHVAACPGEGCGWVFADPRGRRRWCSMAWCGNRNKARRHAERTRRAPG